MGEAEDVLATGLCGSCALAFLPEGLTITEDIAYPQTMIAIICGTPVGSHADSDLFIMAIHVN